MKTASPRHLIGLPVPCAAAMGVKGIPPRAATGETIVPNAACSPNEAAKWAKALAGTW